VLPKVAGRSDWNNPRWARNAFLWPALLVVLALAIFPLIASLVIALSRVSVARGGLQFTFVGFANFSQLLTGTERTHFVGLLMPPTPLGWLVFIGGAALVVIGFVRTVRGGARLRTLVIQAIGGLLLVGLLWLAVSTMLSQGGRPGTLLVTFLYAFAGTALTYLIGLVLAVLASQHLAGQRFFRLVFLLPITITPVGVAYMFRMLIDTTRGPFAPPLAAAGLSEFSFLGDPWGARLAVIITDTWQWTPFMFIVLLAALAARETETEEAGLVDGASKWQIFRYLTIPAIIPVSATIILIRMIEAFKIIDLPMVLTNGGPGTASESLTMQAFVGWRALNLGLSAAIAYSLLIVVTMVGMAYAATIIRRTHSIAVESEA
jgi:multiple sugar transport system permease protein